MVRYWDYPSQSWRPCKVIGSKNDLGTGMTRALLIRVDGQEKWVHPGSVKGEIGDYTTVPTVSEQVLADGEEQDGSQ